MRYWLKYLKFGYLGGFTLLSKLFGEHAICRSEAQKEQVETHATFTHAHF